MKKAAASADLFIRSPDRCQKLKISGHKIILTPVLKSISVFVSDLTYRRHLKIRCFIKNMSNNLSYYNSFVELGDGRKITIFTRARINILAKQYSEKWLKENEKEWKIKDTVLLDEKKEKYLLKKVRNCLLTLPEEGVWHVETENETHYIRKSEESAQRKDNSNVSEKNKQEKIIPFDKNTNAQQHLIEMLMRSADS